MHRSPPSGINSGRNSNNSGRSRLRSGRRRPNYPEIPESCPPSPPPKIDVDFDNAWKRRYGVSAYEQSTTEPEGEK